MTKTPDDLFGVARLVEAYAAQLTPESAVCEHCGQTRWSAPDSQAVWKAKIDLSGVAQKLRRIAAKEKERIREHGKLATETAAR